jgi:hypothetical protein
VPLRDDALHAVAEHARSGAGADGHQQEKDETDRDRS